VQQELAQIIVVVAEVLHLLEHGGNRHVTDSTGDDDVVDFAPTWHLTTLTIRLSARNLPGLVVVLASATKPGAVMAR
jgi:hypothetical protein